MVFLLSFMVLDTMLSLAFLCWPVLSPNYFHLVDRRVWVFNWSPAGQGGQHRRRRRRHRVGQHGVALGVAVAVVAVEALVGRRVVRLLERDGRA